jgi:hypothetical protein
MRTSAQLRTGVGANADDCARLWKTLTTEFVSTLRLETTFLVNNEAPFGIMLELVSPGLDPEDGEDCVNIWAMQSFWNPLHLISWGGLFDLLINGYRRIDDYFRYGEQYAPARRRV